LIVTKGQQHFMKKNRDNDKDDYQNWDYDVAAIANNLSQVLHYGIYNNDDIEEVQCMEEKNMCNFCEIIKNHFLIWCCFMLTKPLELFSS